MSLSHGVLRDGSLRDLRGIQEDHWGPCYGFHSYDFARLTGDPALVLHWKFRRRRGKEVWR